MRNIDKERLEQINHLLGCLENDHIKDVMKLFWFLVFEKKVKPSELIPLISKSSDDHDQKERLEKLLDGFCYSMLKCGERLKKEGKI